MFDWQEFHGRIVTIDGLKWKVRVNAYKAIYPYEWTVTTVNLDPTAATKCSNHYRQIKAELRDDWSTDVLSSDIEFQVEVQQQLLQVQRS